MGQLFSRRSWDVACYPLVFVLAGLGCKSSAEPDTEQVSIAWTSKGQCNSFFDLSAFGARLAGVELQEEVGDSARVELLEPDDCSDDPVMPEGLSEDCLQGGPQIAMVQEAMDREFSVLAISVYKPECVSPFLDEAVDSGMKVLTFDSDAPSSKRHSYYGMDNRAAARFAVRQLADMLDGSGKVAIQTSMMKDENGVYQLSESTSYTERMAGIEEELAEHPELTLVATLPCQGNDPLDSMCSTEIEALLQEHPDIVGLILSRGKVLREVDLDVDAPTYKAGIESGSLRVVAFDAPGDALENIDAGYADLVIAQKQFAWGYDLVHLAYDYVSGEIELPEIYDSGWYVLCQDNVDEYGTMWDAHDFRGTLPDCGFGS